MNKKVLGLCLLIVIVLAGCKETVEVNTPTIKDQETTIAGEVKETTKKCEEEKESREMTTAHSTDPVDTTESTVVAETTIPHETGEENKETVNDQCTESADSPVETSQPTSSGGDEDETERDG